MSSSFSLEEGSVESSNIFYWMIFSQQKHIKDASSIRLRAIVIGSSRGFPKPSPLFVVSSVRRGLETGTSQKPMHVMGSVCDTYR